ncbi:MAG TPA: YraN family protein, partial [Oligoflexia bacterium]|nr:YraN family protein [Oligoflexia bacterium]
VEILTRNFRKRFGEIDIVAKEGATICFVEVRSSKRKSGYVRYSVGFQKQFRLRNVIAAYLRSAKKPMSGLSGSSVRFDVAWVCGLEVEYWKNVELAVQSKT